MADWKIVATIIIVLLTLLVISANEPGVKDFFTLFAGGVLSPDANHARSLTFILSANSFPAISENVNGVNITVVPSNFSADLQYGTISTDKEFDIINFKGRIEVANNVLTLDGNFDKLRIKGSGDFSKSSIKTDIDFISLKLHGFSADRIEFKSSGTITVNEKATEFSHQDLVITYPTGEFSFNGGFKIEGSAEKITLDKVNL